MPTWLSAVGDGIFGRPSYVQGAFPSNLRGSCNFHQIQTSKFSDSRNFSQGGRKHCWWKIDVQIGASSRQQDGSDAGPESFELRVFLQGLRQKQHRWGAAWGIQNRFNQRFCIETVLTQKSSRDYCLEDVAILTERKSSCRLQPSYQLVFQQLEMTYLEVSHLFKLHSPSKLRGSCNFHQIQTTDE